MVSVVMNTFSPFQPADQTYLLRFDYFRSLSARPRVALLPLHSEENARVNITRSEFSVSLVAVTGFFIFNGTISYGAWRRSTGRGHVCFGVMLRDL